MAESTDSILQHLLSKNRKKMNLVHHPFRTRSKPRALVPWTSAEKAALKVRIHQKKEAYAGALSKARDSVWDLAQSLNEQFSSHDTNYYYRLPEGVPKKKSAEVVGNLAVNWNMMTKVEKEAYVMESVEEVQKQCENQAVAQHNTLESISREFEKLSEHTGTEVMVFAVCFELDQYNKPYIFFTTRRLPDYFEFAMKSTITDFAMRMEAWMLSGAHGVVNSYVQETIDLKKKTTMLIMQKLNEVAKTKIPRMIYQNFDKQITEKHGIVAINWPLDRFCSPSDLSSRNEVEILYQAFLSGTTSFCLMDKDEYKRWSNARFQVALGQTVAEDDTAMNDVRAGHAVLSNDIMGVNVMLAPGAFSEVSVLITPDVIGTSLPALVAPHATAITHATAQVAGPFMDAINIVTAIDGLAITVHTKERKQHSDKGKKRGPRKPRAQALVASDKNLLAQVSSSTSDDAAANV
ncbi:uncharacterized protein LAESUDRAFT_717767 [Laetiporus sulphureus 93-53]|uniref:Uncharacterized protein n=1 Tax=Laetiporus sulphureus 93-53 TaxID=1314785 RepID=A0A165BHP1_9APHY|nr:uncharacterized protein LAESUDRAFT_717767 [Laetiporus sulphureus 93-53]KZT01075.1 hypothetical protein LAESUDRAFT_717767 [Laetiporus sulphureus 93-53]